MSTKSAQPDLGEITRPGHCEDAPPPGPNATRGERRAWLARLQRLRLSPPVQSESSAQAHPDDNPS